MLRLDQTFAGANPATAGPLTRGAATPSASTLPPTTSSQPATPSSVRPPSVPRLHSIGAPPLGARHCGGDLLHRLQNRTGGLPASGFPASFIGRLTAALPQARVAAAAPQAC